MLGRLRVTRREFSVEGTGNKNQLGLFLQILIHPSPSSDFPLSVTAIHDFTLPATLLQDHTYRLVLVLQTAGSHIRHGCRCSRNSGFHSSSLCEPGTQGSTLPHATNRLCKPLWPNSYNAGQTCGTEKRNGLPSASGTPDKSETFRLLRAASGRSLRTIVHPGQGFHWPTSHTGVQTVVPGIIYRCYRAKAELYNRV